jgi:hypothetical protein
MKNALFLFVFLVLFGSICITADEVFKANPEEKPAPVAEVLQADPVKTNPSVEVDVSSVERNKRLDEICKNLEEHGPVYPLPPRGLYGATCRGILWCVDNAVRPDGWQLTGWSKIKLDEEFRVSRFKVGIISPEIEASRLSTQSDFAHKCDEFERWQSSRRDVVFGIFWSKEF